MSQTNNYPIFENFGNLKIITRARLLFNKLEEQFAKTDRDKAGNRKLFYSDYALLILISVFNPAVQSLRSLVKVSKSKFMQKRFGIKSTSLGSMSESPKIFDPELLVPVIHQLMDELPKSSSGPGPRRNIPKSISEELSQKIRAVDGSSLRILPQLVQRMNEGKWKLHMQFCPFSGLAESFTLAPEYEVDERDVLENNLKSGLIYLGDRGYQRYGLFNKIVDAGSDYVIRIKSKKLSLSVLEKREISQAGREARVISDEIVVQEKKLERNVARLNHPMRRIVIEKHSQGRLRCDRENSDQIILSTNLIDEPAEVIAAMYELRWCIELFFRFLKQVLGLKRLISTDENAITIQIYCALIACLLITELTEGKVTADVFRSISFYLMGIFDDDELMADLEKLKKNKDPT